MVRKTIEPYDEDSFYLDLFDFAVVDTLMYHYDSKHYRIADKSDADGLSVRLDHGRAYVYHDHIAAILPSLTVDHFSISQENLGFASDSK